MDAEPEIRLNLNNLNELKFSEWALAALTLSTLGVSPPELVNIFGLTDLKQLDQLKCQALREVKDHLKPSSASNHIPGFAPKPIGIARLKALINTQGLPYTLTHINTEWKLAPGPYYDLDTENQRFVEQDNTGIENYQTIDADKIAGTIGAIIEQYSERDRQELLLFWPLPDSRRKEKCWEVLTFDAKSIDENSALRVVLALTIVGFGRLENGGYPEAIANLVKTNQDLSKHIFICEKEENRPQPETDPRWSWHAAFNQNQLLLNVENPSASAPHPIILQLMNVKTQKQFKSWKPEIKRNIANSLNRGLTELMLSAPGILCRIQLNLNLETNSNHESDIRIYAPEPWIAHLKSVNPGVQTKINDADETGKTVVRRYNAPGAATRQYFRSRRKWLEAHPNRIQIVKIPNSNRTARIELLQPGTLEVGQTALPVEPITHDEGKNELEATSTIAAKPRLRQHTRVDWALLNITKAIGRTEEGEKTGDEPKTSSLAAVKPD